MRNYHLVYQQLNGSFCWFLYYHLHGTAFSRGASKAVKMMGYHNGRAKVARIHSVFPVEWVY
jgi:hypothetical protein